MIEGVKAIVCQETDDRRECSIHSDEEMKEIEVDAMTFHETETSIFGSSALYHEAACDVREKQDREILTCWSEETTESDGLF